MKKTLSIVFALVLFVGLFTACAGGPYPSKDIQFYVGVDAGGGTDAICRKITQVVEANTEATFYIVNKPGVADSVGPSLCMDAAADGYTLCNVTYGAAVNAVYDQIVDGYSTDRLKPISLITEEGDSLVASSKAPFKTFEEMIEYARANPGAVRIGDAGIGSRQNMLVTRIAKELGVEFNYISYTSSAPQREAILNGEVDVIINSLGDFASLIESGDGVALVEFSATPNAKFPEVPICKDVGLDDSFLSGSFLYVAGPAEIPDDVVTYLQGEFQKAVESQDFKDWAASVGVTPHYLNSEELAQYVADIQARDFAALDALKAEGKI